MVSLKNKEEEEISGFQLYGHPDIFKIQKNIKENNG